MHRRIALIGCFLKLKTISVLEDTRLYYTKIVVIAFIGHLILI